jgi:hypothetical protein
MRLLLAVMLAAAVVRPNYEIPEYPDKGPEYDLRLPLVCTYGEANCIATPPRENMVDKANRRFMRDQDRLRCANHPDQC